MPWCSTDGNFYLSTTNTAGVLRYSGVSGAALPAPGQTGAVFAPPLSGNLNFGDGMAFGPDGNLYVDGTGNGIVVVGYDGTTGNYVQTLANLGGGYTGAVAFLPQQAAGSVALLPAVTPPATQIAIEGAPSTLNLGTFADPAGSGPWQVHVAWGDSLSSNFSVASSGSLGSLAHTYATQGTYTATVTVTDANNLSGSATLQVKVGRVIQVTNTLDSGSGSLRQAIGTSNTNTGVLDLITFAIPTTDTNYHASNGTWTISPGTPLPALMNPVIIDGTTAAGYTTHPVIELSGASAGATATGLTLAGGNSVLRGLDVDHFSGDGIDLTTAGGDLLQADYVGTNPLGTAAAANGGIGINITSSSNVVGGTAAGAGNLISGNSKEGVAISGTNAQNNVILGNLIGTNAAGTGPLPNGSFGVLISDATNNLIGGTTAARTTSFPAAHATVSASAGRTISTIKW